STARRRRALWRRARCARSVSPSVARPGNGLGERIDDFAGRRTQGDDTFVEAATVPVAIVATNSENDRTLLPHGDVARFLGTDPVVHLLDLRRGGIAPVQGKAPLASVLVRRVSDDDGRHEVVPERGVGGD